jgi:hypothetical protein
MNNFLLITLNFDAAKPLRGALKNWREASLSATKSTGDGHHASYPMQQPGPHATPTASSCTPIPLSPLLSPQPQPRWPACMQHHFRGVHLRSKKQGCSGPVPYHSIALRMPRQRPECCASTRSPAASRSAADQRARIGFTNTRPNSALGPLQSSLQQRRAACYTHTHRVQQRGARVYTRQLSCLFRRHYHGLHRALVAAVACVHTACCARAVVGSDVNLQRVTHAHAAALTAWPRRRNGALPLAGASKRLTDALTKLLIPGTSTRDMSAWVVSINKLVFMESRRVASQILYAPTGRKQSRPASPPPAKTRRNDSTVK